jgi:hypothetical protein
VHIPFSLNCPSALYYDPGAIQDTYSCGIS